MEKINHCANCFVEADCAANNWQLYNPDDSYCPNMKEGKKQLKQFLEQYERDRKCLL